MVVRKLKHRSLDWILRPSRVDTITCRSIKSKFLTLFYRSRRGNPILCNVPSICRIGQFSTRRRLMYIALLIFRQFRIKCGKCSISLYSDDLVMRTSTSIFHYSCFSCSICGNALQQGDEYKIRGSQILCINHFNKLTNNSLEAISSGVHGKKYTSFDWVNLMRCT